MKRMILLLMTIAMVLTMMPLSVVAEDAEHVHANSNEVHPCFSGVITTCRSCGGAALYTCTSSEAGRNSNITCTSHSSCQITEILYYTHAQCHNPTCGFSITAGRHVHFQDHSKASRYTVCIYQ